VPAARRDLLEAAHHRRGARAAARPLGWVAIALTVGYAIWTRDIAGHAEIPGPLEVLAVLAAIFAARLASSDHDGWAFATSALAIAAAVGSLFVELYPHVMVSSANAAYDLTVSNAPSGHYELVVMSIVTAVLLPVVLLYQGWSFYVFRARVVAPTATAERPASVSPAAPQA
jgi:cytochrome bd ubiquinol oxidase subunit II